MNWASEFGKFYAINYHQYLYYVCRLKSAPARAFHKQIADVLQQCIAGECFIICGKHALALIAPLHLKPLISVAKYLSAMRPAQGDICFQIIVVEVSAGDIG